MRTHGIDWNTIRDLGQVQDPELAQRLGCSPSAVRAARVRRGLPAALLERTQISLTYNEARQIEAAFPEQSLSVAVTHLVREALARRFP